MDVLGQIENIELKIKLLALKLERVHKENAILKQENQALQRQLAERETVVLQLQKELEKSQELREQIKEVDPEQVFQLKSQIDQYLQEIEKCIEWLKNN